MTNEEKKDLSQMSSQEIEDEILKAQQELHAQEKAGELVEIEISEIEKKLIDLKIALKKCSQNIKNKKMDISNLDKIWRWRSLKRERGY